jgi:hypothetical protein
MRRVRRTRLPAIDENIVDKAIGYFSPETAVRRRHARIDTANPGRPNAQFDPFVTAIVRQIGVALELPYEILIKHFTSTYSAARAAIPAESRAPRGRGNRWYRGRARTTWGRYGCSRSVWKRRKTR